MHIRYKHYINIIIYTYINIYNYIYNVYITYIIVRNSTSTKTSISTFFPVSSRCVAKSCRVTQQCSVSPSSRRRSDAQRSSSSATCASARSPMAQPRLGPMGDRRMVASYGWEYSITICYNPFLCQFLSIWFYDILCGICLCVLIYIYANLCVAGYTTHLVGHENSWMICLTIWKPIDWFGHWNPIDCGSIPPNCRKIDCTVERLRETGYCTWSPKYPKIVHQVIASLT